MSTMTLFKATRIGDDCFRLEAGRKVLFAKATEENRLAESLSFDGWVKGEVKKTNPYTSGWVFQEA